MLLGASSQQLHVVVGEFTLGLLEEEMHLPAKRVSPSSLRLGEQGHEVVSEIDDRPNHLRLIPGVQADSLQGRADVVVPIGTFRAEQTAVVPAVADHPVRQITGEAVSYTHLR